MSASGRPRHSRSAVPSAAALSAGSLCPAPCSISPHGSQHGLSGGEHARLHVIALRGS